ncbi:hypothetical protein Tco_1189868, partial [Tanacetum coccineum]
NVAGSGPEWLFDIDSLTKSMNYEPVTTGNQTNGDAGIETNVNAGQAGQKKASDNEYILLPLMLSNSPLFSSTQSINDKDANEVPDKGDDDVSQINGQEKEGGASNKEDEQHVQDFRTKLDRLLVLEKEGYANSTNRDSTASPSVSTDGPSINTASENINTGSPNINTASPISNDSSMQSLEHTGIFDDAYDDREVGAEADLNNLKTTMNVSPIPTTIIHKDHPKDQIIRDINSAIQTRRMINFSEENAMMDVKSAFLYGTIEEEVYVDDIIFGSTKKSLCTEFESLMHKKFQMSSMMEPLSLRLQVMQRDDEIFISQDKYVADILKKFDFSSVKTTSKMLLTIPPKTGNPQYTLQEQGIFNSGCSRHITENKSFLTDYQDIDGGFIAFGGSTKGVIMLELALTGNPQQEVVNFLAKGAVDPKSDA